ncbi:hypothetical protein CapIbe_005593 [Capra ibex]
MVHSTWRAGSSRSWPLVMKWRWKLKSKSVFKFGRTLCIVIDKSCYEENSRTDYEEAQGGIKIAGRYINNLRYADDTTLMAESE